MDGEAKGMEMLKSRMDRASRAVLPPKAPKRPVSVAEPETGEPEADESAPLSAVAAPAATPAVTEAATSPSPTPEPVSPGTPSNNATPQRTTSQRATKPKTITGGPPMPSEREYANMTLRVRRSLDMRAADLVDDARREHNFKTSKAELVEMLLSDLPVKLTGELLGRLREFRATAPRP